MHDIYWYKAKAIRIVDGDTVDFEVDLGMNIFAVKRVRVYGINCPEIHGVRLEDTEYAEGMKAKDAVVKLLLDSNKDPVQCYLKTHRDKTGKYGRFLAEIYIPEEDINWDPTYDGDKVSKQSCDGVEYVDLGETLIKQGHATRY